MVEYMHIDFISDFIELTFKTLELGYKTSFETQILFHAKINLKRYRMIKSNNFIFEY